MGFMEQGRASGFGCLRVRGLGVQAWGLRILGLGVSVSDGSGV